MVTVEPDAASHPREAEVVEAFRDNRSLTRAEIATRTGLSRSTVSEVLGRLIDEGAVQVVGHDEQPGRGRPTERVQIDRTAVRSVGVDLAHGVIRAIALGLLGDELARSSHEHDDGISWERRRALVSAAIGDLRLAPALPALRGVGLGVSGPVQLTPEGNSPFTPIVTDLATRFGVDVQVDNTTRFAAFAEHLASPGPAGITLHIRCFHGIGGAVIRRGKIDTGATGMAGEVGHLHVESPGAACRCGRHGCLETIASTPAMLDECRTLGLDLATAGDLRRALTDNRDRIQPLLGRVTHALAQAMVVASTLIDPDEIILSGDLLDVDDSLLDAVRQTYARTLGKRFEAAPVGRGRLGGTAGALGAALAFTYPRRPATACY